MSVGELAQPFIFCVVWYGRGRDNLSSPRTPRHLWQVGDLAQRSYEWESSPRLAPAAVLWRLASILRLGSTVELALMVQVWESQP